MALGEVILPSMQEGIGAGRAWWAVCFWWTSSNGTQLLGPRAVLVLFTCWKVPQSWLLGDWWKLSLWSWCRLPKHGVLGWLVLWTVLMVTLLALQLVSRFPVELASEMELAALIQSWAVAHQ